MNGGFQEFISEQRKQNEEILEGLRVIIETRIKDYELLIRIINQDKQKSNDQVLTDYLMEKNDIDVVGEIQSNLSKLKELKSSLGVN